MRSTRHGARRAWRTGVLGAGLVAAGVVSSTAHGQVATVLLAEGDPAPWTHEKLITSGTVGATISTAVNHAGGYAAMVNVTVGTARRTHVWGTGGAATPGLLLAQDPWGWLRQGRFERSFGLSNAGHVVISSPIGRGPGRPLPSAPGFVDSLWINGQVAAIEASVGGSTALPWRSLSRPGITADDLPYWVGGLSQTAGGHTVNQGLFLGNNAQIKLLGGTSISGAPGTIATRDGIGAYAFSALGTHCIAAVQVVDGVNERETVVLDGTALTVGGALAQAGAAVGASGALTGEQWRSFTRFGMTESGPGGARWILGAVTSAAAGSNEIIVRSGAVVFRTGSTVDGHVTAGPIRHLASNESGDVAFVCKIVPLGGTAVDAMFINNRLVLRAEDGVDLDGDGAADAGASLVGFAGMNTVSLSDRDAAGHVLAYFSGTFVKPSVGTINGFLKVGATLPPPLCAADFNADGVVNVQDFLGFLAAYSAGEPSADFNGDGVVAVQDFLAFLAAYSAGCA
jgi:hypothetical protein